MAEISKYPIQEQAIVLSLLNTGVRRAELAGLTWSDFNFRDCTVHVNKSLLVFKDFGYQHTTTKESNDRYIDVAPEYMTFMQRYKEWWDTKKKLMGASWQRDMVTNKEDKRESLMKLVGQEFVIIDDFGWPRNPDGYNKLVKRVAQKAGISEGCTLRIRFGQRCTNAALRMLKNPASTITSIPCSFSSIPMRASNASVPSAFLFATACATP